MSTAAARSVATYESAKFERLDWFLLVVAAGVWGASFLFTAIGLDAFEPGLVTFLRVGFGCATLWAIPTQRAKVPRSALPRVAGLGVLWMAFPLTMFPLAQQWIDSSLAGMLNAAMPVATVLVGLAIFGAPVVGVRIAGVGVGLLGIVMISLPEATSAGTTATGIGLVLLAVASYGFAINIAGPLQRTYGSLPVLRRALLVATIFTLPYGIIDALDSDFGWGPLVACAALGIGGTGLAYLAMANLTGRVGAVRSSVVTYLIPLFSSVLGVVFRDETIGAWAIGGTVVVLAGAYLTTLTGFPGTRTAD